MSQIAPDDLTRMLSLLSTGDQDTAAELLPIVYDELRMLAGGLLESERDGHTLQPTALVHEAYLRLAANGARKWNDRGHFFRVAAIAMRHILINHARARASQKRGGGATKIPLDDAVELFQGTAHDLISLDDCLNRFATFDPRGAQVVELRFFAGLSVADTALALNVSDRTVEKDWQAARRWLLREL